MVNTALLFVFLLVACFTDFRRGKIYNWTTYPGILLALCCSAAATLFDIDSINGTEAQTNTWGFVHIRDSVLGFLACAGVMLVCYVFFMGKVGGGDVKLIAMIGAFLGVQFGLRAMLWTFVIGGCLALIHLVWRYGALTLARQTGRYALYLLRFGVAARITEKEREPLQTRLYLAPSALAAAVIVRFQLVEVF